MTKPLKNPASAPNMSTSTMTTGIGNPICHSTPINALEAPSTEATDKSISAATMMSVIGSAISAISVKSASMLPRLALLMNIGESTVPNTSDSTSTMPSAASQVTRKPRVPTAATEWGLAMIALPHHAFSDGAGQQRIDRDGRDDQRPLNGLLPERRHAQHD